ncbi:hypothetical protein MTR67_039688 [Solanum verrucosum]|uniref:Uncharacterized protein n=1 Tax=Solanum verrucosum TaxID=315347 RepID=A0AAF0UIY0_SOLVR|nr:hypothetical protein MTR67_039688 [Solanum verrucosum]
MMKGYVNDVKCVLRLHDTFPFVRELETRLSHALELCAQSAEFIQLSESDVCEFIKFMHPVKFAMRRQKVLGSSKIGVVSKGTRKPAGFGELSEKSIEYQWILEHRSHLFEESFEYIGHVSPRSL